MFFCNCKLFFKRVTIVYDVRALKRDIIKETEQKEVQSWNLTSLRLEIIEN
jgi:hypothetical protein